MATIQELESFNLNDAVKFHEELNPKLWTNEQLDPDVRKQLLVIAEDFVEYLGVSNLNVEDVTISGSNAAFSWTPHSDLDLHILVDFNNLPNDPVYQELFTAKKTLYNDAYDITVREVPVELYVQDTNQVHTSLGEYSVVHDKWIRIPKKRRANFDEPATKLKYEKLGNLIELALKSKDIKRVKHTLDIIKRYRKSGLEKAGEFGPENLSYKLVRKHGLIQKLFDLKAKLHAEKLSIEEDVGSIADTIKSKLGLKQFIVTERGDDLILDSLIVGKENQGQGLGSKAMKELIDYADQNSKRIILTPGVQDKNHGTTSRSRLVKFYKSLGFKENKGRSIDYAMGAGKMYRDPAKSINEYKEDLKSYKNPSPKTLYNLTKRSAHKHMRGMYHNGNTYWWDANDAIHADGSKLLGIPYDYLNRLEAAIDNVSGNYYVGGDDGVPAKITQRYDIENELVSEDQLDETAEENQIVNVVSNIAAAEIAKVMKAKENKLLKLLDMLGGETSPKDKLELFGMKVKDLNVPKVNNPLLKKLFNILYIKVNSHTDLYDDPSEPRTLGGYYDGEYTIELFFPALEYAAGKKESQLKAEIASTLSHEIQHAIDDYKSDSAVYGGDNINPAKDMQGYLKLPYEVNARFQEATMDIAKYIAMPKKDGSRTTQADLPELIRYAFQKNRLDKIYEKNQKEYKRLLSRAYKFFQAELNAPKKASPIPQSIAKRALAWILGKQTKEINESVMYHVTPTKNLRSIMKQGLTPKIGDRSAKLDGEESGIFLFPTLDDVDSAVSSWLGDEFGEDEELSLLAVDVSGLPLVDSAAGYEKIVKSRIAPDRISLSNELMLEASGYIPSQKEKNDPRFKTALTVDVKPNSIKKNAKAFGFKTSRAGIPPQARADGKITESKRSIVKSLITEYTKNRTVTSGELVSNLAKVFGDWKPAISVMEKIHERHGDTFLIENTIDDSIRRSLEIMVNYYSDPNPIIGNEYIPVMCLMTGPSVMFFDVLTNNPAITPATFGTLEYVGNDHVILNVSGKSIKYPNDQSTKLSYVTVMLVNSAEKYDRLRTEVMMKYEQSLPPLVEQQDLGESLMSEWKTFLKEDKLPGVGYHVTATKNLPVIRKNGIKADSRGNSYVWDSVEMAEWFANFQNDEGQDRTILKIDMTGIDARPDPEAEDMSEWSSRFEPGTNGGAWIVSGPIPPDKIIG